MHTYAKYACYRTGERMAEIQLRNVGKRWGAFVGVNNFDLTIADQEFLVLLGPCWELLLLL